MLLTYGMQYLDKAVLGFAAVYTLQKDNVGLKILSNSNQVTNVYLIAPHRPRLQLGKQCVLLRLPGISIPTASSRSEISH